MCLENFLIKGLLFCKKWINVILEHYGPKLKVTYYYKKGLDFFNFEDLALTYTYIKFKKIVFFSNVVVENWTRLACTIISS